MEQLIENLEALSKKEKLYLRLKNFMKIRVAAYSLSALAGVTTGHFAQETERNITGYSPVKHEQLIKEMEQPKTDFDEFKKGKTEKEKHGIRGWFSDIKEKIKQNGLDPMRYIENTETYKSILLKYYNSLKFIDDVSFLLPAILMFIMLGGYVTRKLSSFSGDIVAKKQNEEIIAKINELVDSANQIKDRLINGGPESFTEEELNGVRNLLLESKEALPDETEISSLL